MNGSVNGIVIFCSRRSLAISPAAAPHSLVLRRGARGEQVSVLTIDTTVTEVKP